MRLRIQAFLAVQQRSATWFARELRAAGQPQITQSTMSKILHAHRTIYAEEAAAMAAVMGLSLDELIRPA